MMRIIHMTIDYFKILKTAETFYMIFNIIHQKGCNPLINIIIPLDMNVNFAICPNILSFIDSWTWFQGFITAFLQ